MKNNNMNTEAKSLYGYIYESYKKHANNRGFYIIDPGTGHGKTHAATHIFMDEITSAEDLTDNPCKINDIQFVFMGPDRKKTSKPRDDMLKSILTEHYKKKNCNEVEIKKKVSNLIDKNTTILKSREHVIRDLLCMDINPEEITNCSSKAQKDLLTFLCSSKREQSFFFSFYDDESLENILTKNNYIQGKSKKIKVKKIQEGKILHADVVQNFLKAFWSAKGYVTNKENDAEKKHGAAISEKNLIY